MYILFTGKDDISFFNLLWEIKDWSVQYNISYKIKLFKNGVRLILPERDNYFYFCLTWNPERNYDYKLIEPMKVD